MKTMRRLGMVIMLLMAVVLLGACTGTEPVNEGQPDRKQEPTQTDGARAAEQEQQEPVTLKVATLWPEDMFNERIKKIVEEKYPYMTMELLHVNNFDRSKLEELFSLGETPDIFFTLSQDVMEYLELDFDLTEPLAENGYDLSHIQPTLLDTIRARDKQGRLLGLPYETSYYVLMYNKDIFDQFGEPYPSDDLTWDDAVRLAHRLTKTENGVQYRGLDFRDRDVPLWQFSVNATDPDTGEVLILERPEYRRFLELYKKIIDIPGNYDETFFNANDRFTGDRTTAMLITNAQGLNWWGNAEGLNFDVASLPTWPDQPGITHRLDFHSFHVNPNSKHIEEALRVIYYLTTPEVQEWTARNGIGPITQDTSVQEKFFYDNESTHGKNITAIFKHKPAPVPERISLWDRFVELDVGKFAESGMDASEFLRVVKEEAEIRIKEERSKSE